MRKLRYTEEFCLATRKQVDEVAYTDDLTMGRMGYKYELGSKYGDPRSTYELKEAVGEIAVP